MADELDVPPLSSAQEVGMALAHSQRATDALRRAADQQAIIVDRPELCELLDRVRVALAVGDESDVAGALFECRDWLADTLGVDREV